MTQNINEENLKINFDKVKLNTVISNNKIESRGEFYDILVDSNHNFNVNGIGLAHNGGRRPGAFTLALPMWHRDLEDFLEIQSENKDPRRQCFDIFPQLCVPDLFMKEATEGQNGGTWHTFCPYEVKKVLDIELFGCFGKEFTQKYKKAIRAYQNGKLKNVSVYNAKDLMKKAMHSQFETGLPYTTFIDTLNASNPNSHDGHIPCFNLCTESTSNVVPDKYSHTCNLLSVCAGRVESMDELRYLSGLAARILDNGIELTLPPIFESKDHNNRYRTIGIGIQGMHDYLAKIGSSYDDLNKISEFCENLQYGAVESSINISKNKGPFEAFKGSKWDTGELTTKWSKNSNSKDLDWDNLQKLINEHGIRNSQLTSPAPNSSTAPFMDAAPGFLPVYSAYYSEDNSAGKFPVFGMHIKTNPLSYERTQPRLNQAKLADAVGAAQMWIDTGISAEYVFDMNKPDFTAKSLYDLWVNAWKKKNKAIYYVRSIKKGSNIDALMGIESDCVGCAD